MSNSSEWVNVAAIAIMAAFTYLVVYGWPWKLEEDEIVKCETLKPRYTEVLCAWCGDVREYWNESDQAMWVAALDIVLLMSDIDLKGIEFATVWRNEILLGGR